MDRGTIRRAWWGWAVSTFLVLLLFCDTLIGRTASIHTIVPFRLTPDQTVSVTIFRLFQDQLYFGLAFERHCSDLGDWRASREKDGFLYLHPGTEIRIMASVPAAPPVTFEAMPNESPCNTAYKSELRMTSNLSVASGVWHWPPPPNPAYIPLHRGYNQLAFRVTAVGEPLIGESVDLFVTAPISLKEARGSARWFWCGSLLWDLLPWEIWPIAAIGLAIWAAQNLRNARRIRRDSQSKSGKLGDA